VSAALRSVGTDEQPTTPVERARFHESEADRHADQEDHHRWEAARAYVEALDGGMSKKGLARELGKSDMHVLYVERAGRANLSLPLEDRPRWNAAYQAAKGAPKTPKPSPEPAPDPRPEPEDEDEDESPYKEKNPLEVMFDVTNRIMKDIQRVTQFSLENELTAEARTEFKRIRQAADFALKDVKG